MAGVGAAAPVVAPEAGVGRGPGDRRSRAAKGIVVNAAFLVALNALGFVKGFGVAAFLSPADYGLWGLLAVSFATLYGLVQIGVDDKYIQQDDRDQEQAFHDAFTMQCLLCAAFLVLIAAAMPLYALAYHDWSILVPGYVLALSMPAIALQTPLWAFYRNMDYLTQRRLQVFDPVTGFVVTLGLAAAGLGYWSLVLGTVAGAWAAAAVAVRSTPYPLRLRFSRGTLREYWGFSAPLLYSALVVIVIGQVPALVAKHTVGLAGLGAMAVANNLSQYASRVDDIVTNTLYPAVCAVKDRVDLLRESFMKSNRLALLWATPVGFGIALFAPDLVAHLLGHRWARAIYVVQAIGVGAAINQIGFNWTAFYRALGRTRPIAVATTVMCAGVLGFAIPLLVTHGISGYATGMAGATVLVVLTRLYYLSRLFALRAVLANCIAGMLPTLPAAGAVLALRAASWGGGRSVGQWLAEMAVFGVVVAAVTVFAERALLREFRGYLRGTRPVPAAG